MLSAKNLFKSRDSGVVQSKKTLFLSKNDSTKIYAWTYIGGIRGLFFGLIKAFRFIKKEKESLRSLLNYAYYFAGDWKQSDKLIELKGDLPGFEQSKM